MRRVVATALAALRHRRILVVEDEYMIAQEIAEMLSAIGAEALGPVPRLSDALRLIAREDHIDGALLDVNLNNEQVWPVADALRARNVRAVLVTGYDAGVIPAAYADLPLCEKPATGQELVRALIRALAEAETGAALT